MPLLNTDQYGASYVFGVGDADAPVIANFSCRGAELKYDPEVRAEARNGEGHVEGVSLSKPAYRMITGSFTGYITHSFNPLSLAAGFNFAVHGTTRFFLIGPISEPRKKGEYTEVTIEATSNKLVTS